MQSYSGFASLPLPDSTKFENDQELSLELGLRPCESLEPGLPCPALPCPALLLPWLVLLFVAMRISQHALLINHFFLLAK